MWKKETEQLSPEVVGWLRQIAAPEWQAPESGESEVTAAIWRIYEVGEW